MCYCFEYRELCLTKPLVGKPLKSETNITLESVTMLMEVPASSHVNTQAIVVDRAVFRIVYVSYTVFSSKHSIVAMTHTGKYLYLYLDYHRVLDSGQT